MTTTFSAALGLASLALLTASCLGESGVPGADWTPLDAGNVAIEVAALDLPDVTSALYTISVRNLSGQTIAAVTIDSADYGSGQGSATYITPCDADPNEQPNQVTASLVQLFAGNTPVAATMPPPIVRPVTCVANQDTLVELDFTVVRNAQQGFFDIKATVDDIFCSAKLDCSTDVGPGVATNVVIGFVCGAGDPALVDTHLYMTEIAVTCGAWTATFPPDADGYVSPGDIIENALDPDNLITTPRVYRGAEAFSDLDAIYWNISFGLTNWGALNNCSVTLHATATDGSIGVGAGETAPYASAAGYPVVDWNVPLTFESAVICGSHPLGDGSEVQVTFPADGQDFSAEYAGTGP